jgi:hypothetical protein
MGYIYDWLRPELTHLEYEEAKRIVTDEWAHFEAKSAKLIYHGMCSMDVHDAFLVDVRNRALAIRASDIGLELLFTKQSEADAFSEDWRVEAQTTVLVRF